MAQTAFSIRMDEGLKRDFSQFCENIGMTMSTAFVVFAKAALRSRRIPFEIYDYPVSASPMKKRVTSEEALKAFESIRADVQSRGVPELTMPELTMEEIDAEIAAARKDRRERQAKELAMAGAR